MRRKTRYPGVYQRVDANGKTRFDVYYKGSDRRWRIEAQPLGTTAKQAFERRSQLVSRMSGGERIAPTRQTVQELWEEWIPTQNHLKPKTLRGYQDAMKNHVLPAMGHLKVAKVNVNDVALLIASMREKEYKAWTIRGALTPLSRLMAHAVRRGLIGQNPVTLLERQERPQGDQAEIEALDTREVRLMLEAATGTFRPLLTTAVFTGLRLGELLALEWTDVDFDKGRIRVRSSKTKAGVREVVMVPLVWRELEKNRGIAGRVFRTRAGEEMKPRTVQRALEATLVRAGLRHIRFHDLRHTFASIMISQGMDIAFVSKMMGHANVAITYRVYGHLIDKDKKAEQMRQAFETQFGGGS